MSTTQSSQVGANAKPFLHGPEAEAVAAVLAGGQYGHSRETEAFERELARFLGVPEVVAVASGTDALHIALLARGIGEGDEVVVPSMTFCASVQAILMCGAVPRFADVDPGTLCVTPCTVMDAITAETRAVMPVLYGGRAVDLSGLHGTLAARGIAVVEDAAQAFGSFCGPHRVGARPQAATCFSFGPIKQLTCGQGGVVVPRTPEEATSARSLRMLGIVQPQSERLRTTTYTVERTGLRAPLSGINAAIGRVQLRHFESSAARRGTLWRAYQDALRNVGEAVLVDVGIDSTVPFNCVVRVPRRDAVFRVMQAEGIAVGVHYPPNHLQPAFSRWHRDLPATEMTAREILTLPFHPAMTCSDADHVVTVLERALRATCPGTVEHSALGSYARPSATTDSSTSTSRSAASGRP
ncbi:DegT/DnrJ/EryC1/StrS family aminotransferase [Streptomyces sp. B1866]|uniref:DegT/DnrJ/EryC1/StrS family aminotransferase n=1 Tax=Streptomyces sp. B1866 TaxID=3075431 RepID=UPI00289210F1|nr:DegT/DnrJ/EryC1/StrS family aminotransferase [Streptomyces sp. B1866]MDT3395123.1 DegT/DnrJ/EryC1/StrS family aminotransferase [Streptomyces sp. B1866]